MAYQSLYRRYRSARFDELVGQKHVVTALKNAIVEGRVGHAYLFSGPRGTGKTSTARILGKALNCTNLGADGEPCCECDSCRSFTTGTSYDLQELDAASNNGVEAIRDLISKVALGSPGRTKVYILDEVHMLTAGAENALLKTLEEPPDHVVFVLATTEPHKVVPTIRSRTQHFEFELIPAAELEHHVRWVADDAGLTITDEMVAHVLRAGGGSARDTLSALDQVVAAGGVPRDGDAIDAIVAGLAGADAGKVLTGVEEAIVAGRDPRVIGEALLDRLRDAFLSAMGSTGTQRSEAQSTAAAALAEAMGPASITRGLEVLGTTLIEMRQAPDPRVDLEVALLRLSRPELDTDLPAIVARLERLERGAPVGQAPEAVAASAPSPTAPEAPPVPAPPPAQAPEPAPAVVAAEPLAQPPASPATSLATAGGGSRPAAEARAALARLRGDAAEQPSVDPSAAPNGEDLAGRAPTLGAHRASAAETAPLPPAPVPPAPVSAPAAPAVGDVPAPVAPGGVSLLSLAAVEAAWPEIRAQLPGRAKSRFSGGRFLDASPTGVVFGLPNAIHRDRCAECVGDVEAVMSQRFATPVTIDLVVDDEATPPTRIGAPPPSSAPPAEDASADDESIDFESLVDAAPDEADGLGLLTEAFPGAEIVEPD